MNLRKSANVMFADELQTKHNFRLSMDGAQYSIMDVIRASGPHCIYISATLYRRLSCLGGGFPERFSEAAIIPLKNRFRLSTAQLAKKYGKDGARITVE
jgi:hypothetical protein